MARDKSNLGNRIGPRVAKVVADALVAQHHRLGPHKVKLGMQLQEDFFRLTGSEIRDTFGPIFAQLADHPDADEQLAKVFAFLARGHGQWQTLLANATAGQALSVGVGQLINNAMAPVIGKLISEAPQGNLDAGTFAAGVASGRITLAEGARGAAFDGIRPEYFQLMVELAATQLPPGTVLDLINRGHLSEAEAQLALHYAGMDGEVAQAFMTTRRQLISPAVAADAVIRGLRSQDEGAAIAGMGGMTPEDFQLLVDDTGESLAIMSLLEAYRRGIIDDARLAHGIRTGRTRNEWIDVVKALRYAPPSPAEAITAAVQNHLSIAEATAKAQQAGLDPAEFDWLYQTHGEPIATGQALSLWNRGVIGQAEVEQVIRESRTKTKYVPAILQLRRHLLPERTVASMYGKGALTKAQATQRLADLGVDAEDITALLAEHSATKTGGARELSLATVLTLYAEQAISEASCRAHLSALGYSTADADLLLTLQHLQQSRKLQLQAIAVVRAKYVARHVDATTATAQLDAARVNATERDQLLAIWQLERDVTTRLPTVAELSTAYKAQVIDGSQWAARLVELGYSPDDVPIMAAAHKVDVSGG